MRRFFQQGGILSGSLALVAVLGAGSARATPEPTAPVAVTPASPPVAKSAGAPVVPPEDPKASVVLNKWILAIGGPYAIRDLTTLDSHSKITYRAGDTPVDLHIRSVAHGQHYCYEYKMPTGTLVQAYDGKSAWQHSSLYGFGPQSTFEHRFNLLGSDFRSPLRIGLVYPDRVRLPDETIDGRKLAVLRMRTWSGVTEKWYFDPETDYRVRIETPGATGPVVVTFSDFRNAFGAAVKEPYHIVRTEGDQTMDTVRQVILYNEEMDEALFAPSRPLVEENAQIEKALYFNTLFRRQSNRGLIETRVAKQTVKVTTSGLEIQATTYQKRPNLAVTIEDVPGMGQVWQGYDGKIGWAWNEIEGFREMHGAELQQFLGGPDIEGSFQLSALCPLRRWLGESTENGRNLIGIALANLQGSAGVFYFDAQTFELAKLETTVQAGANGQLKVVLEFGDYRMVDGMMIPFRSVMTNPAMRIVTTIESVEHNVPIDEKLFEPKRE